MKVETNKKIVREPITHYENKEVEEITYISDDGKEKSSKPQIIRAYENRLINKDKLSKIISKIELKLNILEQPCGYAFYLNDEDALYKFMDNYFYSSYHKGWEVSSKEIPIGKWFTYERHDGGDCSDYIYFHTLEEIYNLANEDCQNIAQIINP